MEIEYQFGEEDLLAFSEYHLAQSSSSREVRRRKTYGYAGLLAVFGLIFLFLGDAALAIAFLTLGPLWMAYWPWQLKQIQRKQLLARYWEGKNPALEGRHVLRLEDDGLVAITPNAETRIALSSVLRVVDTPDYVFVYVGAMQSFIVPRRRVSRGDVDIFVQQLRNRAGEVR